MQNSEYQNGLNDKDSLFGDLINSSVIEFIVFFISFCIIFYLIYEKHKLNKPKNTSFIINYISNESLNKYLKLPELFESSIIPHPKNLLTSHSASLAMNPTTRTLYAFWFSGSKEATTDVKIWRSEFKKNSWTVATPIIDPELLSKYTKFYTRMVGNPVSYVDIKNKLHLFVVSVGLIGGWSYSSVNHLISSTYGNSWDSINRLMLSPILNISTLVRTSPIPLIDGGFYLPVYNELLNKFSMILRFDKDNNILELSKMNNIIGLLQASIVPVSSNEAISYFRSSKNVRDNDLLTQRTLDSGISWGAVNKTNLKNYDSSLITIKIDNEHYIMIHNNKPNRSSLVIAISKDGINFKDFYEIENKDNYEFSYPVALFHDGVIDLLYTMNRECIKHLRFNLSWLFNRFDIKKEDKKIINEEEE